MLLSSVSIAVHDPLAPSAGVVVALRASALHTRVHPLQPVVEHEISVCINVAKRSECVSVVACVYTTTCIVFEFVDV